VGVGCVCVRTTQLFLGGCMHPPKFFEGGAWGGAYVKKNFARFARETTQKRSKNFFFRESEKKKKKRRSFQKIFTKQGCFQSKLGFFQLQKGTPLKKIEGAPSKLRGSTPPNRCTPHILALREPTNANGAAQRKA